MAIYRKTFFVLFVFYMALTACRKEDFLTDPSFRLEFSIDTVMFDTVFTTIGSTTERVKVYNRSKQPVKISSVYLGGGYSSYFRLNVDGVKGNKADNIEIPAKDSIFIFVEVTINPQNSNNPLLISDSIMFLINSQYQQVQLEAWGQDVHLYNDSVIDTRVWTNDKPYLIYNGILVDENQTLTIEPGARIHLHKNAIIYVAGTIQILGSVDDPVTFQGDRLEDFYDDIPEQWNSIHILNGSTNNIISNAVIKNAIFGVIAGSIDTASSPPDVFLYNTKITNMSSSGIFGLNPIMKVLNCEISNCGQVLFIAQLGGDYEFYNCTFANYWNGFYSNRTLPSIILKNYLDITIVENNVEKDVRLIADLTRADFGNCIIYATSNEELGFDELEGYNFNFSFKNSSIREVYDSIPEKYRERFTDVHFNDYPEFRDVGENDFQLDSLSPARNIASQSIIDLYPVYLQTDFNGNSRNGDEGPDLGAYEWVPVVDTSQ